jgi:hypothetical protein
VLAELKQTFLEAYDENSDGKIDIREVSEIPSLCVRLCSVPAGGHSARVPHTAADIAAGSGQLPCAAGSAGGAARSAWPARLAAAAAAAAANRLMSRRHSRK